MPRSGATARFLALCRSAGSALGEVKVAAAVRVVGVSQDVEQARAGGDQQAVDATLGGTGERLAPGCPALRGRGLDPALHLIPFAPVLEASLRLGELAEGTETGQEDGESFRPFAVGNQRHARVAQAPDGGERSGKLLWPAPSTCRCGGWSSRPRRSWIGSGRWSSTAGTRLET